MKLLTRTLLLLLYTAPLFGQQRFYWSPANNQLASDPNNWRQSTCTGSTGIMPAASDTIIFSPCASVQNCTLDQDWNVAQLVMEPGYTGTVSAGSGMTTLTVQTAKLQDGTFHGGTAQINIEKKLLLDGAVFVAPAETLSVKEEFAFLSGTFQHNNGTVIFKKGTGSITKLYGHASSATEIVFNKVDFLATGNFGTRFHVNDLNVRILAEMRLAGVKPLTLATASGAQFIVEGNLINDNSQSDLDTLTFRFAGQAIQTITGTAPLQLYRLELAKPGGYLQLHQPLAISAEVLFSQGYLTCDSANALTFLANAVATGSGGMSFVRGVVRKIGNEEFLFPIGEGWRYRPLKITPPKTPTDEFVAYYGYGPPPFGSKTEGALTYLSRCEYWALHRTAGTSAVSVRLFYDSITCDIDSLITLRIARWNAATQTWKSTGPAHISGTLAKGTIITTTPMQEFGYFTIGKESPVPTVDAGPDQWVCPGTRLQLGGQPAASGGTPPYSYSWSPEVNLDSNDLSNPYAIIFSDTDYILTVTDADDVVVRDTVRIKVFPNLTANAGADRIVAPNTATTLGAPPQGGKAPYTYHWQPSQYLNQTNVQQPVATPLAHTVYTLTVTDANGCASTDQVAVMLTPPALGLAGTFSLFAADSILAGSPVLVSGRAGSRTFISANLRATDSIVIRRRLDSLALADLNAAVADIKNLSGTILGNELGGQQLTSGIYLVNGSATFNGTLTCSGDHRTLIILRIADSLAIGSGALIQLNGINKNQVYILAEKGIRGYGTATLPAVLISGKDIYADIINQATLLSQGTIKIAGGAFAPASHQARPIGITRTDAADWLGINSTSVERVAGSYQSHWASAALRRALPLLNTRVIRFPPGGKSKSWNANDGWYIAPEDQFSPASLIYDPKLRCVEINEVATAEAATLPVNRMLEFRHVLTGNDARALYVSNLYADMDFEVQVIRHMLNLGITLDYVELGNEFYLRGQTCGFRTPADYAASVNNYLNVLHNTPGLDHIRVGIVGSAFTTEDGLDISNGCRRMTWNAELLPLLNGLKSGDAITFHLYPKCGLPNSKAPIVEPSDIPSILSKAYAETEDFRNHEMKIFEQYPHLDAWITEYNLTDPPFIIHGSWVHGLYLGLFTLRLLELPKVRLVNTQTMVNNASRGLFFADAKSYTLNDGWSTIGKDVPTQPWGLTAGGLMIKQIADALRYCSKATLLRFEQAPVLSNTNYPLLYGWTFDKDLGDKQSLLFNFSSEPMLVEISQLAPYSAMEQLFCTNPLLFVTGQVYYPDLQGTFNGVDYDYSSGTVTPSRYDSLHVQLPANTKSLWLPPFSVTRLYVLNTSGVWLRQSGNSVCAADPLSPLPTQGSTAVNLYASGGARYEWTVGEAACPQQSSLSVSPPNGITGTLKVYSPDGTLLGQKSNITITALPLPQVTVTPSSFNNAAAKSATFSASAAGALHYNWSPIAGLSSTDGATVTLAPPRTMRYHVIGTASNQCSRLALLQASIEPSINLLEFGGTLTKNVYPPTTRICKGSSVNLFADSRADQVRWLTGDGTLLAEGPAYTLAGNRNMLVVAEATNSTIPATSRTALWVEVIPTVETEHADVFGCANTFIQLKASVKEGGSTSQYAWDDQQTGTLIYEKKNLSKPVSENVFDSKYDPVFFYGPSGNYTIRLYGKDPNYSVCPDVVNDTIVTVYVSDTPTPVFGNTPCVIAGGTVTLEATGSSSYTWLGPGLQAHIGPAISVSPSQTTTYTLIAGNNQCCASATVDVNVETFTATCDDGFYCYGCWKKTVSVAPYDPTQYSYQWYVNDIPISGATGASHTVTYLGFRNRSAQVYCAVTKLDGSCAPGRTNAVKMTLSRFCRYGREYPPDQTNVHQQLLLYPNPADQQFTVRFRQEEATGTEAWLHVYDLQGTVRYRKWMAMESGQLSETIRSVLPQGQYIVRICTAEGCVAENLVITR